MGFLKDKGGSKETQTINPQVFSLLSENYTKAKGVADAPYKAYGGQRVAGLSPTGGLANAMTMRTAGVTAPQGGARPVPAQTMPMNPGTDSAAPAMEVDFGAYSRGAGASNYEQYGKPNGMSEEQFGRWFHENHDADDGRDPPMRPVAQQPQPGQPATGETDGPAYTFGPAAGDAETDQAVEMARQAGSFRPMQIGAGPTGGASYTAGQAQGREARAFAGQGESYDAARGTMRGYDSADAEAYRAGSQGYDAGAATAAMSDSRGYQSTDATAFRGDSRGYQSQGATAARSDFRGYDAAQAQASRAQAFDAEATDARAAQGSAAQTDRSLVRSLRAGQVATADRSAYFNPFENEVVQRQREDGLRDTQIALNSARTDVGGSWGGSRQGVLEAELMRDRLRDIDTGSAQLRMAGFDRANDLVGQDIDRTFAADSANAGFDVDIATGNTGFRQQTGESNADRETQISDANAGRRTQISDANSGRRTQISDSNAGRETEVSTFNTGETNNARRFTADAFNTNSRANADRETSVSVRNADATDRASEFGAEAFNTAERDFAAAQTQTSGRNADGRDRALSFGAEADNRSRLANADRATETSRFNTTEGNTARRFGVDASNTAERDFAAARTQVGTRNADAVGRAREFGADADNREEAAFAARSTDARRFGADTRFQAGENFAGRQTDVDGRNADRFGERERFNAEGRTGALRFGAETGFQAGQNDAERGLRAAMGNQDAELQANGQRAGAASLMGSLGRQRQDMGFNNADAVRGVGTEEQRQKQRLLDILYGDFVEERDWGLRGQDVRNGALGMFGRPMNSDTKNRAGASDTISQGLQIASLFAGSDRRIKKDIEPVGYDVNGRRWYAYRYKTDAPDTPRRLGVMAQDLLEGGDMDAVSVAPNGFYQVDYAMIGGMTPVFHQQPNSEA